MATLLQKPLNIVAVSGGLNSPSKTEVLLQAILDELAQALPIHVHFIKFNEIGHLLGGAMERKQLPQRVQDDLTAVETADALLVGTPVYRASFTGLFKHFFDFVEQTALLDVPVLLAASGGSERHALVLEHQLRPLFSFFQAQTLPIGVYATDKDFSPAYTVQSELLANRISLAITRALPIFEGTFAKVKRTTAVKEKVLWSNQNVSINRHIEHDAVRACTAVPNVEAAESRLQQNITQAQPV